MVSTEKYAQVKLDLSFPPSLLMKISKKSLKPPPTVVLGKSPFVLNVRSSRGVFP